MMKNRERVHEVDEKRVFHSTSCARSTAGEAGFGVSPAHSVLHRLIRVAVISVLICVIRGQNVLLMDDTFQFRLHSGSKIQ